jgi:hypothetical protein
MSDAVHRSSGATLSMDSVRSPEGPDDFEFWRRWVLLMVLAPLRKARLARTQNHLGQMPPIKRDTPYYLIPARMKLCTNWR